MALTFQLGVYTVLAISFFSMGSYRVNHVISTYFYYKFDLLERSGLILASITNALWLPIFELSIWEMQHMVAVTKEKNVKEIFTKNHDMTIKPENYLKEKREQEKKEFEENRPFKIK